MGAERGGGPDPGDALSAVEETVRQQMRELADARLSLEEARRSEEDHVDRLLLDVIEAIDAFDRVFTAIRAKQDQVNRQMKIWMGNFRTVKRLLQTLVDREGARPIQNLEGGFDPHWHRVAETVADPSRPEGTIVEEVRRGYVRSGRILRKSEVVVVKNSD